MKRKVFFAVITVMLFAFSAFTIAGCGSSSNDPVSSDDSGSQAAHNMIGRELTLSAQGLDMDGDNKPDVLDFDGAQQLYIKQSGSTVTGEVPFMVWISALAPQTSPDIVTTTLTAGTTYTFEVSKNLADSMGGRIPDVTIKDPSGNAVDTELTVYPEEQPSMVLYTFTPETTGTYTAEICTADGNVEGDTDVVLFVYKEMHNYAGENGYYSRFIISNLDNTITSEASVRDVLQLRKNFLEANPYYLNEVYGEQNDNGTRNRNNDAEDITENTEKYDEWMDILKHNSGIIEDDEDEEVEDAEVSAAAAINTTQILTTIYDVPYDNDYQLGTGFMATTNLQALQDTALMPFKLTAPTTKTGITKFTYSFISSTEDYEQKMGKNFSLSLTKAALGTANGSVQTTNNLKFGLTSTTLVIHY